MCPSKEGRSVNMFILSTGVTTAVSEIVEFTLGEIAPG